MKIGVGLSVASQEAKQNQFYPQDALVVQIEVPAGAVDSSKNYYKFLTSKARSYTVDWGDGTVEVKTGTETTVAPDFTTTSDITTTAATKPQANAVLVLNSFSGNKAMVIDFEGMIII